MLQRALSPLPGSGGGIINDFTSVECVSSYTGTSSIVSVVFNNIPDVNNAIYLVVAGSYSIGTSYNISDDRSAVGTSDGVIIIQNGNVIFSGSSYGKYTLNGTTLTSITAGRNVSFGLFKISN